MSIVVYAENDQIIELPGLRSGLDQTIFLTAATVIATMYNSKDIAVSGFTNITLNYISGAPIPGTYRGQITSSCNPPIGGGYWIVVEATQGGDKFHIELDTLVAVRTS